MLTPGDIRKDDFTKAGRGTYKAIEVDAFLDEVYASYAQLYKENGELIKKLQLLADRIESYRQDEDSIRSALLTAQRMADTIMKEANDKAEQLNQVSSEKAKQILDEVKENAERITGDAQEEAAAMLEKAQDDSRRMIENAKNEVTHEKRTLERMQKEVSVFRARLMAQYKAQVEMINTLPTIYEDDEIQLDEEAYMQRKEMQQETAALEAVQEAEEENASVDTTAEQAPEAVNDAPNDILLDSSFTVEDLIPSEEEISQEFPAADLPDDEEDEEPTVQSKGNIRFGTLKFGADYSMENDEEAYEEAQVTEESPRKKGFFKKK